MAPGTVRIPEWVVVARSLSHAVLPLRGSLTRTLSRGDWTPVGLYGVGVAGIVAAGSGLPGLRPLDRAISPLLVLASGWSLVAIVRTANRFLSSGGPMRTTSIAVAFVAALMLAPAMAIAAVPCGHTGDRACDMPCCAAAPMPCCDKHTSATVDPIDILTLSGIQHDLPEVTAARQTAVVWFHRPVWVGRTVLLGKYVIEHDTDRQARGEACTHIYAADKPTLPVVTFHCTHLEAATAAHPSVVVQTRPDGTRKLLQFQFAGESAAHGYPAAH